MKRIKITLLMLCLMPLMASAQLVSHHGVVSDTYNFWVNVPEGAPKMSDSQRIPGIVFLHGKSLCGNDLNRVRKYGPLDALAYGMQIDAVIIAPQNPGGAWDPKKLMKILEWCEKHYPIDTDRVYCLGMSLGGSGTVNFVGTYPDKIAAGIAMCGRGWLSDYGPINRCPLWIIHGQKDAGVPWQDSRKIADQIVAAGGGPRLQYTLIPEADHGKLARCFYLEKTYKWLFSHNLKDEGRPITKGYDMTWDDIMGAYSRFRGKQTLKVYSYSADGLKEHTSEAAPQKPAAPSTTTPASSTKSSSATKSSSTSSKSSGKNASKSAAKYHVVKSGECLSIIAEKEHTTVDKILKLNKGLKKDSILQINQKIRVK